MDFQKKRGIDLYTGAPRYKEPKTSGERMFANLGYFEKFAPEMERLKVRGFEKEKAQCFERITFEKHKGGICFSKTETAKTRDVFLPPPTPDFVQPKELEAIIQIIAEWSY